MQNDGVDEVAVGGGRLLDTGQHQLKAQLNSRGQNFVGTVGNGKKKNCGVKIHEQYTGIVHMN